MLITGAIIFFITRNLYYYGLAGGFPDNALSSIKVPSGFRVVLYESENFRGKSFTISESRSGFTAAWNDKISSFVVYRN
ncbi:MAG: hypothetical protein IPK57_19680 [Chitinophagaceae bacterium]|nr:hypothetical protein [Chitinophagaceae bacterium]